MKGGDEEGESGDCLGVWVGGVSMETLFWESGTLVGQGVLFVGYEVSSHFLSVLLFFFFVFFFFFLFSFCVSFLLLLLSLFTARVRSLFHFSLFFFSALFSFFFLVLQMN